MAANARHVGEPSAGAIVVRHRSRRPQTDTTTMEQIHRTASAYYANLSEADRQMTDEFRRRMTREGVTWGISLHQYTRQFGRFGISREKMRECFDVVDENRDDRLEFDQFVTFYYLHRSGRLSVSCGGHGCTYAPFLMEPYFVCVDCFDQRVPFYLCTYCYRKGKYAHSRRHCDFKDSWMLLQRLMRR